MAWLKACVIVWLVGACSLAQANINFSYLSLGYARDKVSAGTSDCSQSGLLINGAMPLNEFFYAVAQHQDQTSDSWCGVTKTQAGAGMHQRLSDIAEGFIEASVIIADYPWDEHIGLGLTGGVRATIVYGTELKGFFAYESIDGNDDNVVGIGLNMWMNKDFSGFLDIGFGDETKQRLQLGVRYNF